MDLSSDFWNGLYHEDDTGWDMGVVSPSIKKYVNGLADKSISVLIPGAGNSHEAEYLHKLGFENVVVVDIAPQPLQNIKSRVPDFPENNLRCSDFFELIGKFDLIIEQTFFCAIDKTLRHNYARQVPTLLKDHGKLVGVLFNELRKDDKPPFGGNVEEYKFYFSPYFDRIAMDECYNSHPARMGREVWISLSNS
ncbi:MAG: SAM-dependent methyltransferase [Flavobacteriales bacterium]|nr:SAM-dependent methyltransferase [Flavobacteriales bacterium]